MVEQYPYVALYKVLLAKKYKEEKNKNFQEVLQQAAVYSPNRNKLYHYINVEKETKVKKISEVKSQEPIVKDKIVEEVEVVEENKLVENIVKEKLITEQEITQNESSISNDVELEVQAKEEEKEFEEHSFVEWLAFLDGNEVVQEENVLDTELERHRASAEYEVALNDEITNQLDNGDSDKIELTIDEKAAVDKLAEGSITLTTGVVTETLAKIMLMQGKINDAIAMYRALSLKFPEKSNYFAAQIEKIKKN